MKGITRPGGSTRSRPIEPFAVLLTGLVLAPFPGAAANTIVLENAHLSATFEPSDAGPRLTEIRHLATGVTHRIADDVPVSLFVVPAGVIHDPALAVQFSGAGDFSPGDAEVGEDRTSAVFRFRHALVRVEVSYRLDPQAPELRKTIICTANDKPVYVAGVRQWALAPAGMERAWPKAGTVGQPVVLVNGDEGYLLTLEWLRALTEYPGEGVVLSYRPGFRLEPNQRQEVSTGSIVSFQRGFEDDTLEAGRRAFFDHLARRVSPTFPCPIKFTTWGPWLGQARADRILEIVDDLAYVGTDLLHFDAGWQWPDHPYSERLPKVRGADDATWDAGVTQPERVPDGLLPLLEAARSNGMKLSLWFDARGNVFVRDTEDWAVRDAQGQPMRGGTWEKRWKDAPIQSLASVYGDRLREFTLEALERYDLGGVMFDNNHGIDGTPDHGVDHACLANGWDSADVEFRRLMEIFDECGHRRPGIYRFLCNGTSLPWALQHVTHIHAGDPGTSEKMREAAGTDYPARAMAHERRLAWKRHYDRFVPPWGVKGDIAGWSLQQHSPIPIHLAHADDIIACGEGWTQNMFTCFATTAVRDIRFSFTQMPAFDREILKEWLAWGQDRSRFIFNCRQVFEMPADPNRGVVGFSHVGEGQGVLYLFKAAFEGATATLRLDEQAGFRRGDAGLSAYIVYPVKARLGAGTVSYGDALEIPIAGKDCVVIEVGLDAPRDAAPYVAYERMVKLVRRSFRTLFLSPVRKMIDDVGAGPTWMTVGNDPRDRRVAKQIVESLGAAIGRRMDPAKLTATARDEAACDLFVGTHEGLSENAEVGELFREVLYNRYVAWDRQYISAPVTLAMGRGDRPVYGLVAPRPEQLARLAIDLTAAILKDARALAPEAPEAPGAVWEDSSLTVRVPAERGVLRFRPLMKLQGALVMPNDLSLVRYEIRAAADGAERLIWSEEIPPFATRAGDGGWWQDRVVSLSDLADREVTFQLSAKHVDGRDHDPRAVGGFDRVAVMQLGELVE